MLEKPQLDRDPRQGRGRDEVDCILCVRKLIMQRRIISEADVLQLLAHERRPRNKMLLLLIYAAGLRVSEACGLAWRDVVGRDDGGQITVFGKGGKTRTILLPASVYDQLEAMRAGNDDPVFRSLQGGHPDPAQVRLLASIRFSRAATTSCTCCR